VGDDRALRLELTNMEPSLFERIGGERALDAAVDLFYGKVLSDERIAHHFSGIDMNRLYRKQKAFLTLAFGGDVRPAPLISLRQAHARLNLTEGEFDAVIEHLDATLVALSLPDDLIARAMEIAQSVRSEVLNL
jgi:hemoglobin